MTWTILRLIRMYPENPKADGPRLSEPGSWASLSLGGPPGVLLCRRALTPTCLALPTCGPATTGDDGRMRLRVGQAAGLYVPSADRVGDNVPQLLLTGGDLLSAH